MRTEQEVLKDFEELGFEVVCDSDKELILERKFQHCHMIIQRIHINKQLISYSKSQFLYDYDSPFNLDMQEHKLLNELFKIWWWI